MPGTDELCAQTRVVMDREAVVVLAAAGDGAGEVLAVLARRDRQGFRQACGRSLHGAAVEELTKLAVHHCAAAFQDIA